MAKAMPQPQASWRNIYDTICILGILNRCVQWHLVLCALCPLPLPLHSFAFAWRKVNSSCSQTFHFVNCNTPLWCLTVMLTGFDSPPSRVKLSLGEVFAIQISCRRGKGKSGKRRSRSGAGKGVVTEAEADYRQLASVAKLSFCIWHYWYFCWYFYWYFYWCF